MMNSTSSNNGIVTRPNPEGKEGPDTACPSPRPLAARIQYRDGRLMSFSDDALAYQFWLSLPRGTRAAFRAKGGARPVYAWAYADRH